MPWGPLTVCASSRAVWPFSTGKTNTIEDLTPKVAKVSSFTVHFPPPHRAARIRRPLSRIRPGRALRRGKGATRRKRRRQNTVLSERRFAVPGREAGSIFGTANTIEEMGCRKSRSLQIYIRSGAPDFGIANTIEDLGHRIAPRP